MALRVLLADESVTIKKVFQLALQDFAVEVTSVTVGLDVMTVAEKVKPDIVFADVLLQKKSGYDVCREMKAHPTLSNVPVVLMWSGFMELDQARYKNSGANAQLEKPFDTQRLRQVVNTLVPKTQTQPLSPYLTFPKLPDFEEGPARPLAGTYPPAPPPELGPRELGGGMPDLPPPKPTAKPTAAPTGSWSMDSFEPIDSHHEINDDVSEDFMPVQLPSEPVRAQKPPPLRAQPAAPAEEPDENQWFQKTLSKFKLDPSRQTEADRSVKPPKAPSVYESEDGDALELDLGDEATTASQPIPESKPPALKVTSVSAGSATGAIPQLNEKQLEAIIRAQSQEVIEKVVWQVVPEIATRIIERELERLLKERKSL